MYLCTIVLVATVSLSTACGRIGFDRLEQTGDSDSGVDSDASATGPDASPTPDADAALPDDRTRLVAETSCGGATESVSIDAAGVPLGALLLVQVVRRNNSTPIALSDSKGNAYLLLSSTGPLGLTIDLFQTTIATPLLAGDTINAVHGNSNASSMIVVELSDLDPVSVAVTTSFASDGSFVVGFSPPASGLVYCGGGIREGQILLDSQWQPIANVATDCGGATGFSSNFAFSIPADGTASDCAGAVDLQNGFQQWVGAVSSYATQAP